MFVPHAKVRIVGLGPSTKKKRFHRRRLAIRELLKMPCLVPTAVIVFLGLIAVGTGTGMAVAGYLPRHPANTTHPNAVDGPTVTEHPKTPSFYLLKVCSYLGPLIMAFGVFAIIVALVLYCEIVDKYSMLVPDKKANNYEKEELYQVIVGEMKKSYAQCLITAYTKAAERSMALDNQSSSGEYVSEHTLPYKPPEQLTLDQQIDIECEGYTPSPPIPNKKYSVIQARIQRLRSEDNWLKTSSLPNIRRSENASIRRAGRVARLKQIKNNSLSCDYTMDEARLRRKSMMLRSFLLGSSCSSGELRQKRGSRRFSSVKVLPTENALSWEEISQVVASTGSFPMTRLVQRRGTFACGDMRMRRMKFLLLLQASESKDRLQDNACLDRRVTMAGIRRNSFIPYTDCDRFISTEEKKRHRDRRQSFNPFIPAGNRLGHMAPPPPASSIRRHSFFPIRRDDQIYVSDPYEQRRHSFNPIGISNTLKPEYENTPDSRRGSLNIDALHERVGDPNRRGSFIPSQKSNFLTVPGLEMDHLVSERHPAAADSVQKTSKQSLQCPEVYKGESRPMPGLTVPQDIQEKRHITERRHSYNLSPRPSVAISGKDSPPSIKVPKIVINAEASCGFLNAPIQDHSYDERRHSFNCADVSKPRSHPSTAVSFKNIDRPTSQRNLHRLLPDNRVPSPLPLHPSPPPIPMHDSLLTHKTSRPGDSDIPSSLEVRRPSNFKDQMVVFKPLSVADSRSVSPVSNVSCCGSEKIGTTRTASISSERTNRTVSPVSVAHTEGPVQDESLERPPSSIAVPVFEPSTRYKTKSPDCHFEQHLAAACEGVHSPWLRRPSSFRSKTQGSKYKERSRVQTDSPGSVGSGPATLHPSTPTSLDASQALHRSKSASAIPSGENVSTPPFVSYATLSPSASTARPVIKDKTRRGRQRLDTEDRSS